MKDKTTITRRSLFTWGAGIIAALASSHLLFRKKKNNKLKTTKMLTRDGKLVEVDIRHVQPHARLASKKEVQTWVWPRDKS